MGFGNNKTGVQIGIYQETKIPRVKTDKCFYGKSTFYSRRNKQSFTKKSHRNSTPKEHLFRFLQHIVPCTQKEWGNETSHKFKTSKRVSLQKEIQNGHFVESSESSGKRRLGNIDRFKGCLLPYKNVQRSSSVSAIHVSGNSLPVQSSLFRSNKRTQGICKDNVGGCGLFTETEHSTCKLPRRLDLCKRIKNVNVRKQKNHSQSAFPARFNCKQNKIATCPCSNDNLHRGKIRPRKRSSLPNSRKIVKLKTGGCYYSERSKYGKTLHDSSRHDSFLSRINPECKVVHETYSAPFTSKLEPIQNGTYQGCVSYSSVNSISELVVTGSEHSKGQIPSERTISDSSHHRCKWQMGLGWSHEQSNLSRSVEQNTKINAHQLSGITSSDQHYTAIPVSLERLQCSHTVRQHNCMPVHKPSRGHSVSPVMWSDFESLEMGYRKPNSVKGSPYQGNQQCPSRCSKSTENKTDRVVLEQCSGVENIQSLGPTNIGSFCHISEQENPTVLFMDSSSSSLYDGCPVHCLAEHVCVCIPTITANSESTDSCKTVSMHNDSCCSTVAKTILVHSVVRSVGSMSTETSMQSGSVDSVQGENIPSTSGNATSDCMAVIDQCYSSKGFSKRTRKLLAKSWRSGTQKDYRSKFRRFASWCRERDIDPYLATLANCVDFLTSLFHAGLKYRTINGYRSMLSSVLDPVEKIPIGQHPYVIRLLRAVFNERPPLKSLVPEWDLLLVLGCLKKAPFEPLSETSLKLLTWKTCFLVAITTFRRCSDLQSLQLGEGSANVTKQGVTFRRIGLSKQDRPNHFSKNIFVPALPHNKLLDPKRALTYYLKKTEVFRRNDKGEDTVKLFLARKKPHKPVTSQTISRWLVELIQFCYKQENKVPGKVKGHSTRSIGPSWALFRGASLQQVMETADWSRETTFTRYYLKSVNTDFLKV